MAGHHTVLKIKKKSWSSSPDYHVGQNSLEAEFTVQSGWTIQTEMFIDDKGNRGLKVKTLKTN